MLALSRPLTAASRFAVSMFELVVYQSWKGLIAPSEEVRCVVVVMKHAREYRVSGVRRREYPSLDIPIQCQAHGPVGQSITIRPFLSVRMTNVDAVDAVHIDVGVVMLTRHRTTHTFLLL